MVKLYHGTNRSYISKIKEFGGLFATEGIHGYTGIHMTTEYRRAEEWAERAVFNPNDIAILEVTIPQEYERYLHPDFNYLLSSYGQSTKKMKKEIRKMKWQDKDNVIYNPCIDPTKFTDLREHWGREIRNSKKCMVPLKWIKVCKSDDCEQKSNL